MKTIKSTVLQLPSGWQPTRQDRAMFLERRAPGQVELEAKRAEYQRSDASWAQLCSTAPTHCKDLNISHV
jgi:hypothetical protein